jgi:hypothetical protein
VVIETDVHPGSGLRSGSRSMIVTIEGPLIMISAAIYRLRVMGIFPTNK